MKLKLFRYSGTPVRPEDNEKYMTEFRAYYDKAAERAGLDMLRMQRYMRFGEYCLIQKYNQPAERELPTSARQWNKLIAEFGDTPISLARTKDGKQIVMILMDQLE